MKKSPEFPILVNQLFVCQMSTVRLSMSQFFYKMSLSSLSKKYKATDKTQEIVDWIKNDTDCKLGKLIDMTFYVGRPNYFVPSSFTHSLPSVIGGQGEGGIFPIFLSDFRFAHVKHVTSETHDHKVITRVSEADRRRYRFRIEQ